MCVTGKAWSEATNNNLLLTHTKYSHNKAVLIFMQCAVFLSQVSSRAGQHDASYIVYNYYMYFSGRAATCAELSDTS